MFSEESELVGSESRGDLQSFAGTQDGFESTLKGVCVVEFGIHRNAEVFVAGVFCDFRDDLALDETLRQGRTCDIHQGGFGSVFFDSHSDSVEVRIFVDHGTSQMKVFVGADAEGHVIYKRDIRRRSSDIFVLV